MNCTRFDELLGVQASGREINRLFELPGARIILTMPLITRVNNVSAIPDLYLCGWMQSLWVVSILRDLQQRWGIEEWHSEFQHGKQLGWSGSDLSILKRAWEDIQKA